MRTVLSSPEQRKIRGDLTVAYSSSVTATTPEAVAWNCIKEGSGWVLGKSPSLKDSGHRTGPPGQWSQLQNAGVQGVFVQCS